MLLKFLADVKGEGGYSLEHLLASSTIIDNFGQENKEEIAQHLAVAWNWLKVEGFIAPRLAHPNSYKVTKRGRRVADATDFERAFSSARVLPRDLLHPLIRKKTWPDFVRGDYASAVFKAYRELEVAVRATAGLHETEIGLSLIKNAFHYDSEPLRDRDPTVDPGERRALFNLAQGAYGFYRNPTSHRHVPIGPDEAAEMIVLASHLMKIVEARGSDT